MRKIFQRANKFNSHISNVNCAANSNEWAKWTAKLKNNRLKQLEHFQNADCKQSRTVTKVSVL